VHPVGSYTYMADHTCELILSTLDMSDAVPMPATVPQRKPKNYEGKVKQGTGKTRSPYAYR
jgi:hypothetical protein